MDKIKFQRKCLRVAIFVSMTVVLYCPNVAFSMGMSFGGDDAVEKPSSEPVLSVSLGPFSSPVGVDAVYSRSGLKYLLVSDASKRTVNRFDPEKPEEVRELFMVDGLPLGIAKDRRFVYVGNRSKGTIDVYSSRRKTFQLLRQIRLDQPMQPNDIAVDSKSRMIFVADGLANDVKVFTSMGQLVRTIDGFGDLFEPKGVAVHPKSKSIAISDAGDPKTGMPASVQVYDYSGFQVLHKTGGFSVPQGVALSADRLFVADSLLGKVLVFAREGGALLGSYGSFGTDPGELLFPLDLVFDEKRDMLYVVNNRMGQIVAYDSSDFQEKEVSP